MNFTPARRGAGRGAGGVAGANGGRVVGAEALGLLGEPGRSVVAFRRRGGGQADYQTWGDRLLAAGTALLTPTTFDGGAAMRVCIVNPRTTVGDLQEVLATLGGAGDHAA